MDTHLRLLEAILFAAREPLPLKTVQERLGDGADAKELLAQLKDHYAERGIVLMETDGAYSLRTAPDLAAQLQVYAQPRRKVPRVAAEVLAIIAYHQPVTRGEIEAIRGVITNPESYDLLLELGWIRPGARRETPGRPITWETTPDFLSHFNMGTLAELPGLDELKAAGLLERTPVLANLGAPSDDNALPDGVDVSDQPDPESNLVNEPVTEEQSVAA